LTGTHKKRKMVLEMKTGSKGAKKSKTEKVEKADKVWDLVSDLNPY